MKVEVRCPNAKCGRSYKVDKAALSRQGRCKNCGITFVFADATIANNSGTSTSENDRTLGETPESRQLGRFEIRGRLGAGAFGAVYRAFDCQLERDVALKVPQPGVVASRDAVDRFLREAKASAQLRHPNIVPVYDAGRDKGRYYIASAFIEGHTLADAISENQLDDRESAAIVSKLADGLQYAHSLGIIHRDIKPANVMLDSAGEPHLMDFGLARIESDTEKLTQDGSIMGTPVYMPPEQARGSVSEVSAASDQYSLGVLLYELICGHVPFDGPTEVVIYNVIREAPPTPSSFRVDVPRDLETIALKAMSKEGQARYNSCEELADDLRRWLKDEPISARRATAVERMVRWCKREPVIAGLVCAVACSLAVGLAATGYFAVQASQRAADAQRHLEVAEEHQLRADQKAKAETIARAEAELQRDTALRATYAHKMQMADSDWKNRRFGRLRSVLKRMQPAAGLPDFRGWEWGYLNNVNRAPQMSIPLTGSVPEWIDFAPTDERIATSGALEIPHLKSIPIELWNAATGKRIRQLATKGYSAKWSPDGTLIAGCEDLRTISFWNVESGQRVSQTARLPQPVSDFKWLEDSSAVVAVCGEARSKSKNRSESGELSTWSAATGEQLTSVAMPGRRPISVALTDRATTLSVVCLQNSVESVYLLVDIESGTIEESKVAHLRWGPMESRQDRRFFACASSSEVGGAIRVVRSTDNRLIRQLWPGGWPRFHASSGSLAASYFGHLQEWSEDFTRSGVLHWDSGKRKAMAWSSKSGQLATIKNDGNARNRGSLLLWDSTPLQHFDVAIRTDNTEKSYTQRPQPSLGGLAWGPDGEELWVLDDNGRVGLINIASGKTRWSTAGHEGLCLPVFASLDGRQCFTASTDGTLNEWDCATLAVARSGQLCPMDDELVAIDWNEDAGLAIAACQSGKVIVWDLQQWTARSTWKSGDAPRITQVKCPRGETFAVCGMSDGRVVSRSLADGTQLGALEIGHSAITAMAMSGDSSRIAVTVDKTEVAVLPATLDGMKVDIHCHAEVLALAWHPTQPRVASVHKTGISVWDTESGELLLELNNKGYQREAGFQDEFVAAVWSPDGSRLAGGGRIRFEYAALRTGVHIWIANSESSP